MPAPPLPTAAFRRLPLMAEVRRAATATGMSRWAGVLRRVAWVVASAAVVHGAWAASPLPDRNAARPPAPTPSPPVRLRVATVDNGHMIALQQLTRDFERRHPGVRVHWEVIPEGRLRQHLSAAMARGDDLHDVITVGPLQTPIWARRGLLHPIDLGDDAHDLLTPMREALSVQGRLYAAPFYGESSITLYRKDWFDAAGLSLPAHPTWAQIRRAAERLHDPARDRYGICLRGRPGWGENVTLVTTMVNTFGGQWFDMQWRPQLLSAPWREAVGLYLDLLRRYGPPDAPSNGYNENLALFQAGRCAIWVDASVAASFVDDPRVSRVAGRVGFARAPVALTPKGAQWLWTWALAVPQGAAHPELAVAFVRWATSRDYLKLVSRELGWRAVPGGTRYSTYANAGFLASHPQAGLELDAINAARPGDATLPPSPYTGIQYAAIPQFQAIGTAVGTLLAMALEGEIGLDEALRQAQQLTEQRMRERPIRGPGAPAGSREPPAVPPAAPGATDAASAPRR